MLLDYLDAHPRVAVAGPDCATPTAGAAVAAPVPDGGDAAAREHAASNGSRQITRCCVVTTSPIDRTTSRRTWIGWLARACASGPSAAAEVGFFDERFFMYSEELDWCRRFGAAGWRVAYVPQAEVVHVEGASARLDLAARATLFQTSKLQYAAKWHGIWVARLLRTYMVFEYVARALEETLKLALGSRVGERRARLRVIRSGLRHALRG